MRVRALVLVVPLIVLAACSSGSGTTDSTGTGSTDASGSSVEASTLGPSVPPATAVAAPVAADQLPTASGAFGEKPTLTFPANDR